MPELSFPAVSKWRHKRSALISKMTPYHAIKDVITKKKKNIKIEGKFDYSRALHKDLQDEYIHAYIFGTKDKRWRYLGKNLTDSDGRVRFDISDVSADYYIVLMITEVDFTFAVGHLAVIDSNVKAVLFDIDGTLTKSDKEIFKDYSGISKAKPYQSIKELYKHYHELGYMTLMITGRPYWLTLNTRNWLKMQGIVPHFIAFTQSNSQAMPGKPTEEFKFGVIKGLQKIGIEFDALYRNAMTDISAYRRNGVPNSKTFIIGKNAGKDKTTAIICKNSVGCGYEEHVDLLSKLNKKCVNQ